MTTPLPSGIVPAQLGFLAIYNPSLGATDQTIDDQIIYYASVSTQASSKRRRHRASKDGRPTDIVSQEERNERLRQIGLAQGMVEFAKGFSDGVPVDSIDTERGRVVLHELEPGWWILASIDLTRLPLPPSKTATTSTTSAPSPAPTKGTPTQAPQEPEAKFEYSSREVKPAALILQDLLRAHSTFLLHHASSLSALFADTPRAQCAALLSRYWDLFLSTWNVLLHGNPACSIFGGIKIAACGELGIGVGEEDRGSGEREVLEGLVDRVDGLVDLVVGRFGEQGVAGGGNQLGKGKQGSERPNEADKWLGIGSEVGTDDGAVFLGVGALSRHSLRSVTHWMEDIFRWGENAYGVTDSPGTAGSRSKKRTAGGRKTRTTVASRPKDGEQGQVKGQSEPTASATAEAGNTDHDGQSASAAVEDTQTETGGGSGMDKIFGYLKLGYGTSWSLGTSSPGALSDADKDSISKAVDAAEGADSGKSSKNRSRGYFLVGLGEESKEPDQPGSPGDAEVVRTRTVAIELETIPDHHPDSKPTKEPDSPGKESEPNATDAVTTEFNNHHEKTAQLRPVVFVNRPFIHILLFQLTNPAPTWDDLSLSLSTQLAALQKPLLTSTAYRPEKPSLGSTPAAATAAAQIYDLVYDTSSLTIHSTLPNIPDPPFFPVANTAPPPPLLPPPPPSQPPVWTRVEALNTHNQILGMLASTRGDLSALERTCKTGRGWWIVWNRVVGEQSTGGAGASSSSSSSAVGGSEVGEMVGGQDEGYGTVGGVGGKEIILVRRASDHGGGHGGRGVSASYVGSGGMGLGLGLGMGIGSGGWADGASRLAQGIGVDTRRYVEGLLSLNR